MPASLTDHDRKLALVVQQTGHAWHVHVVARTHDARDLLVEEDRELGCLHAAFGDVVGVVEPDCEELARLHGRQQSYLIERVTVGGIVATDDEAVFDDAVTSASVSL